MHIGSQRTVLERKWVWQELSGMQSDAESAEILLRAKPSTISNFAAAGHAPWMVVTTISAGAGNLEDWEELSKAEKVEDDNRLA